MSEPVRNLFAVCAVGLASLCAASSTVGDVKDDPWVTVKGRVVLADGEPLPEAESFDLFRDREWCSRQGPIFDERRLVDPKSRGVKNVFVWLTPDTDKHDTPFPADQIHPRFSGLTLSDRVIEIACCSFSPHAVAVRTGQTVVIRNDSVVPHNAHWASQENLGENVVVPAGRSHEIKNLKAERHAIQLKCNIHPWMTAVVRVFDHPYYALTDDDGNFEIQLAPRGKFRVYAWHERTGYKGGRAGRFGAVTELKGRTVDLGRLPIQELKE